MTKCQQRRARRHARSRRAIAAYWKRQYAEWNRDAKAYLYPGFEEVVWDAFKGECHDAEDYYEETEGYAHSDGFDLWYEDAVKRAEGEIEWIESLPRRARYAAMRYGHAFTAGRR